MCPDGFLYATIRDGGALMPGQGDALSPRERWDIVNYLRHLQQKSPQDGARQDSGSPRKEKE